MDNYSVKTNLDIDWIGEVPSSWTFKFPKYVLNRVTRDSHEDDEIITCFRDGIVTLRKNRREDGFTNSLQEHGYQQILPGDLVVHQMDGFAGAIGISDSKGKSTPVYTVIEPDGKTNLRYVVYLLREMARSGKITSLAKSIRQRSTEFKWQMWSSTKFPFPPLPEQTAIANYLDEKTTQIDSLIEKIERKIELLGEQRTALINQAVTKGLDLNVEMKDSGIEWIGKIPRHWEVKRLKYVSSIENGSTPKSDVEEYWNGSLRWFTPTDFKNRSNDGYLTEPSRYISDLGLEKSGCTLVENNSLLMTTRAPVGNLTKIRGPFTFNQGCKSITPINVELEYLYFSLITKDQVLNVLSNGTTFKELPTERLLNFEVCIPPKSEQKKIKEFLDEQCEDSNGIILKETKRIELLKEYRQSLISNVVTGKVRVVEEMA